jgi:hypothetical protein
MNMIYESIRNKGGLVLVPSDALRSMNLGTVMGAKVYSERLEADATQRAAHAPDAAEASGDAPDAASAPEGGA